MNFDQPPKPLYAAWEFYAGLIATAMGLFILIVMMSLISLRWLNPPTTSFILQQNWDELEVERYNLKEFWVSDEEIPLHMKWAVIASEDQLFYEHHGFDIESIREAYDEYQEGIRTRGASTITQQVVKNLFLWPGQSFFRKGIEAGLTVFVEFFWPKERIIEIYLNIAEFGPGIFGIGKASEEFFGLHASELEPDMAARLASVLPNPKRMRVEPPSPFAKERSQWVLRQMSHLTGISYLPEVPKDTLTDIDPVLWDSAAFFLEQDSLFSTSDSSDTTADSLSVIKQMEFPRDRFPNVRRPDLPSTTTSDTIDTLTAPPIDE